MTKRFVEANGITLEVLQGMTPGTSIGPFREGFMVNPKVPRRANNCGFPDAYCTIYRFGELPPQSSEPLVVAKPVGRYGIIDHFTNGSQGPKMGGQTAEEVLEELLTDTHSAPGEIKNKGEIAGA